MKTTHASCLKRFVGTLLVLLCLIVAGCHKRMTKQEIVSKGETARTKQDLEKVLGKPDVYQHLAKLERWTYRGTDGDVTFHVVGDRVMFSDTVTQSGETEDQNKQ